MAKRFTKIIDLFLSRTAFTRRAFFFISDVLLISFAIYASLWLRFNGVIPPQYIKTFPYFALLALGAKLVFLITYNLYDIAWRYVSLGEIIKLFKALSLGSLTLGMVHFFLRLYVPFKASPLPRSVLLIDFILSLIFIGSLRIAKRALMEGIRNPLRLKKEKTRVLIFGAGSAGEQIIREMIRNENSGYMPTGLIDDDPAKQGIKIHGIKVLGTREDIPKIVKNDQVDEVLIALPSADSQNIKDIVQSLRGTKIENIKILPGATDIIDGKVTLSDIHEVALEDLLGRATVKIDRDKIREFIHNKRVLITGAGGSIGSELTKSILQFIPKSVIVLDIDETEIFNLCNRLEPSPIRIIPVVGDIKEKSKMDSVFAKHSPDIVIHSAAYKHVPILEVYPEEGVKTNVQGTKTLAELSLKHDVKTFIFISTDKAINPTSVMGATKRVGEELLKTYNLKDKTRFISVRFGNVLGSRGSVIPLFREQIKKGGPVIVTHPEMNRYFMTTSEAVLLVLEAAAIGKGGEVFVLDMGEPIKILDLAKEMIRLSGYEPDVDIPIMFSRVRPGEKLFEEILGAEEGVESTEFEKIFQAKSTKDVNSEALMEKINLLVELSYKSNNKDQIIELLRELVSTYTPSDHDLTPVI